MVLSPPRQLLVSAEIRSRSTNNNKKQKTAKVLPFLLWLCHLEGASTVTSFVLSLSSLRITLHMCDELKDEALVLQLYLLHHTPHC
eukprot:gene1551-936_t